MVFASKRSNCRQGFVNLQSRQESTMDGQRYRHVLCRTGHSNNLEDAPVEDSALTWTCCIASLQFVLKLPLRKKILLILTFLSKSIPAPECAKWAFSGSTTKVISSWGVGQKVCDTSFLPILGIIKTKMKQTFPDFLIPLFIFAIMLWWSVNRLNELSPVWIFFTIYLVAIYGLICI